MERVSPGVRSRSGDQRHFEGITLLINEADLPEGWELAGRFSAFGVLQDFWFFFPMQPIVLADALNAEFLLMWITLDLC